MKTIKYDFSGTMADAIGDEAGLNKKDITSNRKRVAAAAEKLSANRKRGEIGFYDLPDDEDTVADILSEAKRVASKYENFVVLGIGGSALGMKCLADALLPAYYNMLPARGRRGCPRLFVCDNIDPDVFEPLLEQLDWKQTCVDVISKSGRTTETVSQLLFVKELLVKKFGRERWKDNVYITTDPTTGPLRRIANEEGIKSFNVPVNVGGRFSVLSSVGLFPAASTGIDIKALLAGAADMREFVEGAAIDENPVYTNALLHVLFDELKGSRNSVMMPYSEKLSRFSDWYAQLLAESLGKEGKGPTPVKSVGVTDQHSQLQLYMDGPNDKVVTIIGLEDFQYKTQLPPSISQPFEYLSNHTLTEILKAEERATISALKEAKRPHITVAMERLDEYNMGALLMAYQIQIACMGMLYRVNPFNQPGVELGKKLTKEILSR